MKFMHIYLSALCIAIAPIATHTQATTSQIHITDSLALIEQELPYLDENSLVIFDRDDTLLGGVNHITLEQYHEFRDQWLRIFASPKTAAEHQELIDIVKNTRPLLIDETTPRLIAQLQKQGVKVIIITGGFHGIGALGLPVENFCIASFKSVGIDLSSTFPEFSGNTLNRLQHKNFSPLFKHGILFASGTSKGDALAELLHSVGWLPKRIIFVDDNPKYLESVAKIAHKLEIPFLGIEYTKSKTLPVPHSTMQCLRMSYWMAHDMELEHLFVKN